MSRLFDKHPSQWTAKEQQQHRELSSRVRASRACQVAEGRIMAQPSPRLAALVVWAVRSALEVGR